VALNEGNHKKANKLYNQINKILEDIRNSNETNQALDSLLFDNDEGVAFWSATAILEIDKEKALDALRKISLNDTLTGLSAQMVIKKYESY
jgi:hypothetical protein